MFLRVFSFIFSIVFFCCSAIAQVQLQTGSGNFSIPMFNWEDDKSSLKTFVSLMYNSGSGLKVNEIASSVGQGWNLISGGMITRMQVGEPDDQIPYNGNGTPEDTRRYPAGFLYSQYSAGWGFPEQIKEYPLYRSKNQPYGQRNDVAEDKQLDYFYFQFNGKSGVFVIDTIGNDRGVALNDERIKITFELNSALSYQGNSLRTSIQSFTIQDVDGLKYKFSTLSIAKVFQTKYADKSFTHKQEQPKFKNNKVYYQTAFSETNAVKPWIVTGWYLTEIEDPLTLRKIQFSYNSSLIDNTTGDDIQFVDGKKHYAVVNRKKIYSYTQDLASIVMPDGHVVDLVYAKDRLDYIYTGSKALTDIDIKYDSRYISKYKLNTSYFILRRYGTPQTEEQKRMSRLCLMSVQRFGVDLKEETPPYKFDYYLGSSADDDVVPPYFSFLKDNWGHYNGFNSRGYTDAINFLWFSQTVSSRINIDAQYVSFLQAKGLCYLQENMPSNNPGSVYVNPKDGYAKNGLLKQVVLPTGGTIKYNYSQNKGIISAMNGSLRDVGGVHVSSTEVTDGGYTNTCSNPLITNYKYIEEAGAQTSSMWGVEMPLHSFYSTNYYAPESKYYTWNIFHTGLFGQCDYRFKYPGIVASDQGISLTGFQQVMNTISPVLNVISNVAAVVNAITFMTGGGGGITLIIDAAVALLEVALTCIGDHSKTTNTTVYFNGDLRSVNSLPMQFKRVEVVEGAGGNGKIVHEFTNTDDLPLLSEPNPTLSNKQRYFPWAYGLPKTITYLNNIGTPIKKVENNYDFQWYTLRQIHGYNSLLSAKFKVNKSYSQRHTDWTTQTLTYNNQSTSDVELEIYGIKVGQARLIKSTEKNFAPNSNTDFIQTETNYKYADLSDYYYYQYGEGPNNEITGIETINSNGDKTIKNFKYSDQYYGGVFDVLRQNHITSLPVSVKTNFQKNVTNSTFDVLDERNTSYTQLQNGSIKPFEITERRYKKPDLDYGGTLPPFKTVLTNAYGYNSKLSGITDEGGRKTKYIYDYNDKYVIAEVINVTNSSRILYTSFENSNYLGEWTLNGTTSFTTANNVTGSKVFTLIPGQNSIAGTNLYDNASNPYRLSFWASGSNFYFSTGGATLIYSGPVKNGYTYYEYQLTSPTTTIAIAASGSSVNIDELRCYPMTARMNTTTYDPLIGKTTECDANNRITYYEYDNLSRLLFVKDADKNIIKAYEHNNVSTVKQNGCPVVYYNNKISEDFRKTNCSSGYAGGLITYTVPAGTYSSTISQEDADAKAEQQLLTYGQSNANNSSGTGACLQIYYNATLIKADTSETCPPGYIPGPVYYIVPNKKYSSTISQADADEQAQDDLDANSQDYANKNPNCSYSSDPFWEAVEPEQTQCLTVNGQAHLFYLAIDVNPNSSSYNQTAWKDAGPSTCTPTGVSAVYVRLEYENYQYNGYSNYADLVIRLYSDESCTIPVVVDNLTVYYKTLLNYYDCYYGGYVNYYLNTAYVISSSEYYIGFMPLYTYDGYCYEEYYYYSLENDPAYIVK